jgi:uncharacterized protein (TIGR03382 family)
MQYSSTAICPIINHQQLLIKKALQSLRGQQAALQQAAACNCAVTAALESLVEPAAVQGCNTAGPEAAAAVAAAAAFAQQLHCDIDSGSSDPQGRHSDSGIGTGRRRQQLRVAAAVEDDVEKT